MKLQNLNLTPTMRCNLKCRLCGVLVPQYEYRPQMSVEECAKTLEIMFSLADRVGRLQITCGEPLLHPQLDRLLELCFQYTLQFDGLWFFSNCAVPFRATVLNVLQKHRNKVVVHCSDYGGQPDVSAQNI